MFWIFHYLFLDFLVSYRLGTVNDFHLGFIPVLSYSKSHTYSTFTGDEKEKKKRIYSLSLPRTLKNDQNGR